MHLSLRLAASATALLLLASPVHAADGPLNVLTTTTDLADIVRTIGGDQVAVQSLCSGPEDPHFLDARPAFIRMAGQADLLVIVGMELEVGYLPLMLRDGSNPRVRPGTPGYLDASARIKKLQVPEGGVSRALGDVHPGGNPHYLLDPANSVVVADDVAHALSILRPDGAKTFDERAKAHRKAISELLLGKAPEGDPKGKRAGGLLDRFKPYKGASIVSYHDNMVYFAQRFGLEVLGTLEPKPGVPPTASHLAGLAGRAKTGKVKAVLYNVFNSAAQVEAFASGVGAQAVLVAHQPGAVADAPDLVGMYRRNAEVLLTALAAGGAAK
jgi:zinc/manganese transport system substrate-binding protein